MRFAKYGMRELRIYGASAGAVTAVVLVLSLKFIALKSLALLITLPFAAVFALVVSFFRDPERVPPKGEDRVLAPADGTVYDIGEVDEDVYLGEKAVRVGIFLSIFDCHVNRAPCSGTVEKVVYTKGRFVSALRANECSKVNESNFVGIGNAAGRGVKVGVKQIAGQIARRIVCELKEGDEVERGQAFGMIKFGSRAELFVPASARFKVRVKLGAAVQAGRTVIGTFEDEKAGPDKEAVADEATELIEQASAGDMSGAGEEMSRGAEQASSGDVSGAGDDLSKGDQQASADDVSGCGEQLSEGAEQASTGDVNDAREQVSQGSEQASQGAEQASEADEQVSECGEAGPGKEAGPDAGPASDADAESAENKG